jgi:phytoene dehydrogenase-like protein
LFTELVDAACLPEAFLRRIRAWRSESGSFRANLALSELPDFACLPGRTPMPHHGSGILIATSLGYLEDAYRDALVEGTSRRPVIELLIPSTIDATLARAGTHVASVFCQHFRFELPDGQTWGSNRERMLARIIDTIDMFAPNFRRSVIGAKAYSPVDLEQRFGLVGGDIFHGALDLDQLYWARPAWGSAQYRSPVPGLYLCASGAHPGGGVTGMPGRNAARAIIFDFRRKGRGLRSLISR